MDNTKFPIILKKRNGLMIGVSILEIIIGVVWGIIEGGIKSAPLWIFLFVGIVTALSVLAEYNQDIFLKENKIEFYKNNDLVKTIKYSNIKAVLISKGNEPKTKKKDFFTISYNENDNKKNKSAKKDEVYLINPMNYSSQDLTAIKNTIIMKNSSVEIGEDVDKFIK